MLAPALEAVHPASPGIVATIDGYPGTAIKTFIETEEDDLPQECVRTTDVVYGRKYGMALVMDVYIPQDGRHGAGVIQIVSGGLWSGNEYRRMPLRTGKIRALADRGYVVFAVMHGSQPRYTFLEVKDDMPRAVRSVRSHAKRFGFEPNRIGLTGISSGGHLALHRLDWGTRPSSHRTTLDAEQARSNVESGLAAFSATTTVTQPERRVSL